MATTMSNEELVQKAVITAETLAAGGKLNDEQSDRFIDYVYDESILPSFARIVRFRNENMKIDKIGLGRRVAMPKAEAVDPARRRGVNTSQVTLTPQEIMVPFEIGDTFVEHNIEGESIVETILRLFARQLNNDTEELNIHGSTAGILQIESDIDDGGSDSLVVEDTFLKLYNGLLTQAESGNIVDAAGDPLSLNLFRRALSAMPNKFKRNKRDLKFLVPVELDEMWRERVGSRATALGDQAFNSEGNLTPLGIEMIPVPLLDFNPLQAETKTFTGSGSTIQLGFSPIVADSVIVMKESAVKGPGNPRAPYVVTTDYTVDAANGTITHVGAGGIGTTEEVRVTYRSSPQMLLTVKQNAIIAFGRDIRMERDRHIFRGVHQFATTVKMDVKFEELTAVVKVKNISDSL